MRDCHFVSLLRSNKDYTQLFLLDFQLFNNYSMEYALIVTVGSMVIREQQGLSTIISFRISIIQ